MREFRCALVLALLGGACLPPLKGRSDAGATPVDGGAGGSGGAAGAGGGGALPPFDAGRAVGPGCDLLSLLRARCESCHGAPLAQGAPYPLQNLDQLRAPSPHYPGRTVADRSLIRMRQAGSPMPPAPEAPPTTEETAVLVAWLDAGRPDCVAVEGEDAGRPDAGAADGGPRDAGYVSPNLLDQSALFTCRARSPGPARLRRLGRAEWTRNVAGSVNRSWTGFSFFDNPFDPNLADPYSTYSSDETLDQAVLELFLNVVDQAGVQWSGPFPSANRLERLRTDTTLRCMFNDAQPSPACVRHYLEVLLEHGVLFRPPTAPEVARLQAFATQVLADEAPDGGQNRTRSIVRIVSAAWLTTAALFRSELGGLTADGGVDGGVVRLTDAELAQALAYAISDRGPGAPPTWVFPDFSAPPEGHLASVAAAGRDGSIQDAGVIGALLREHAGGVDLDRVDLLADWDADRRSRRGEYWLGDKLGGFFREWLGYGNLATIFKERPEATSAFDDGGTGAFRPQVQSFNNLLTGYYGKEPLLVQHLDDLIARVVVEDQQVLATLLTTRRFYVAATTPYASSSFASATTNTHQVYNLTTPITDTRSARWVTLPATERAGVLTHPAFLHAHGGNFEDDPSLVKRGAWVREKLLCDYIPPLSSVMVVAQVGPSAPTKTARDRVDEATNQNPTCVGCHRLMNSLGYPFEIYNHAGFLRVRDHGRAPSGASTLTDMPDPSLDGPVTDAVALAQKLAQSPHVKRCFVRQTFRYFMGRDETLADACTLVSMEQAYDTSNGSFVTMLQALFTDEAFRTRRAPGAGD